MSFVSTLSIFVLLLSTMFVSSEFSVFSVIPPLLRLVAGASVNGEQAWGWKTVRCWFGEQ